MKSELDAPRSGLGSILLGPASTRAGTHGTAVRDVEVHAAAHGDPGYRAFVSASERAINCSSTGDCTSDSREM